MAIINVERLKMYGTYLGFFEGIGYLYKIENQMYTYNKNGITRL